MPGCLSPMTWRRARRVSPLLDPCHLCASGHTPLLLGSVVTFTILAFVHNPLPWRGGIWDQTGPTSWSPTTLYSEACGGLTDVLEERGVPMMWARRPLLINTLGGALRLTNLLPLPILTRVSTRLADLPHGSPCGEFGGGGTDPRIILTYSQVIDTIKGEACGRFLRQVG
jgi:hypothetical protein